ncbi:PAX3- and PAX7-binding protein 1 [Periplaneta americana]|uniref:PAX3- and PAX7-binding protein 1 n=1 Tax=Periplaneta americana TaxID=6978 RepID=UPI0037E8B695
MSLFKKPKKNIRRRVIGSIDDEDGGDENDKKMEVEEEEISTQPQVNITTKVKDKKKERRKQTVLSFEEELNEADDGEVFQVKKSTQSKKIMKLLDRERKKKKEVKKEEEKTEVIGSEEKLKQDPTDLVVVVKPTHKPVVGQILNGRAAEVAGCEDVSSSEEEDGTHPRFSRPDHMKLLLESGRIPDAAMIHAARKRRQMAREMGGDYIPIDNNSTMKKPDAGKRLVREEDEEGSDEERITMDVNTAARDRERRREAFMAAQDADAAEESEKGEDDEWESQQIRKGVTGAQLAAVQQESLQYQYGVVPMMTEPLPAPSPSMDAMPIAAACPMLLPSAGPPSPSRTDTTTPQAVANKLRDRLASLREVHARHKTDLNRVTDELASTKAEREHLEMEKPLLAQKFRYYQELRGYVTDLVECLDEKVPVIAALEQRMLSLLKRRADELVERRRQDVRDQAEELAPTMAARSCPPSGPKRSREEEEARARRAAEREGRRTRRRRAREMKSGNTARHVDGMSSDDEMTELEATAFRNQRDTIESDARLVFADVVDEFCAIRGVTSRFESWRNTDSDAYREAYVSLCLPKVLGPLVRLKMLMWNPLQEGCLEFERAKWYDTLILYGLKEGETEEGLRQDPDLQLVPVIVEKVLLPKLTQLVEAVWDPLSTSQTLRLVGLINRLLQEYPTVLPSSKSLDQLVSTIITKMKSAVENDMFIPIYPKQVLGGSGGAFFQRQFGTAVKLLRNLLAWQGVVADHVLRDVALGSLLNRYLLAALRTCEPIDAADKCNMIVSTFPCWWFQQQGDSPCLPQLQMFVAQLKTIAQCLDVTTPAGREAMEHVTKILQTLQS